MPSNVTCSICNYLFSDDGFDIKSDCPSCGNQRRDFTKTGNIGFVGTGSLVLGAMTMEGTGTAPPPNILIQAVITLGEKTAEGQIIKAVAPAWYEIARWLKGDPHFLQKIDPRKMEEMIAGTYEKAGFDEVILTPQSADFGRDVIAIKRGYVTIRIIDSVKRFADHRLVSANDVRALLGVLAGDPKATKGVVTTTSDFAPMISSDPYISPFIPYRLELVNGNELTRRLTELSLNE